MGFLKSLFGGKEETPESKTEKIRERNFDVLKYDGIRARKIGQIQYAIRCFQEALVLKQDAETTSYLAEALMADRKTEEAYRILNELATEFPDRIGIRLTMAQADEILGDFAQMDKDSQEALLIDANHTTALYLAAKAKHKLQDELNAVALLTRALMQDENMQEAYLLRAEVLRAIGSLKKAEADIDHLLLSPEPDEDVMMQKADLRLQQGDMETAITYYNKVKEQNPMMEDAYVKLSYTYSIAQKLDVALEVMNEALDIMPAFSEGYKERGRIKLLLNDKNGAAEDLKKALETDPETAKAVEGQFTNIEQEMVAQYKAKNPYGF